MSDNNYQAFYISVKGIITVNKKILVVFDKANQKWSLPGGRLDKGEDMNTGLVREVEEEIGKSFAGIKNFFIGFDTNLEYKTKAEGIETIVMMFLIQTKEEFEVKLNDENSEYKWIENVDELKDLEFISIGFKPILTALLQQING